MVATKREADFLLQTRKQDELAARLRGLAAIARQVFVDRNAQGMPAEHRKASASGARSHLREVLRLARRSRDAALAGRVSDYERLRDQARLRLSFARSVLRSPALKKAEKFTGNPRGKGLVRKAIAKALAKRPDSTALELWEALKRKPPHGLEFYEGRPPAVEPYVRQAGQPDTGLRRFRNLVSAERKDLPPR